MTVPYIFANQVGAISLAELDANFSAVGASANAAATVTANAQPNITSVGNLTSLTVTGNVNANYYYGNGSQLTGVVAVATVGGAVQIANTTTSFNIPVAGGNVVGNIGGTANVYTFSNIGANIAGYINATGNIVGGNLSITGNIVGNRVSGNGAGLTSITGTNITGTVANAAYAARAGSATFAASASGATYATQAGTAGFATVATLASVASTAGTVTTNAQPNITSVGTLASLSVTGNVTATNFLGTFAGNISNAVYATTAGTANTVSASAQPNITSVGVLGNLSVNGNVVSGNVITNSLVGGIVSVTGNITGNYFIGNGSLLTGISSSSYGNANVADYLPTYTGALTGDSLDVTTFIFGNNISASGNIRGGNIRSGNYVSAIGNVYGNNVTAFTAVQLPVYANSTVRDTSISSPATGMFIMTGTVPQIYNGIAPDNGWGNITLT